MPLGAREPGAAFRERPPSRFAHVNRGWVGTGRYATGPRFVHGRHTQARMPGVVREATREWGRARELGPYSTNSTWKKIVFVVM